MNISKIVNDSVRLYERGDFNRSLQLIKKTIGKVDDYRILSIIYYNMGLCNYSLNNYEAAEKNYKKSIDFGNDCEYELFLSLMQLKKIEDAKNYWKFRCEGKRKSYPDLPIKRLKFREDSKNILILNEQGLGDEILFSRQIKFLSEKYEIVNYQVYVESIDLFKKYYNFENVNFFTERELKYDFVMEHDHFALSGDFFFNFINSDYKFVDSGEIKYDIGFCWHANSKSPNTKLRSIDPIKAKEIFGNKKILSLQYGESLDFTEYLEMNSLLDTANHILKCNEIFTIDTVVAHLSLMLGKKVTILYKDYLDWRWKNDIYENVEFLRIN